MFGEEVIEAEEIAIGGAFACKAGIAPVVVVDGVVQPCGVFGRVIAGVDEGGHVGEADRG